MTKLLAVDTLVELLDPVVTLTIPQQVDGGDYICWLMVGDVERYKFIEETLAECEAVSNAFYDGIAFLACFMKRSMLEKALQRMIKHTQDTK